jgi:hypothetical protein
METREAPTEAEYPRIRAPDAQWLSSIRLSATIELSLPSASELQKRTTSRFQDRRSLGYGRTTDAVVSTVAANHGESAVRFLVTSPDAIHLRVAIRFSDTAQYRITAYSPGEESRAVSFFRRSGNSFDLMQTVWTPIADGQAQVVVVERLGEPSEWSIDVPLVSHFDRPLYRTDVVPEFFGSSAPCQVDIACVYQVAPTVMQSGIVRANFAVALMTFTKADGLSYSCTGTLLNSADYPSPIFLTAFHCLDDAQSIASLTTTWFYNRTVCGGGIPNPEAKQVAGGATSIFGSASLDAALVVLNQMPPPLATYTGWDASTMQPGTPILAIHHPVGDVKKASFGTELGIYPNPLQLPGMLGSFAAGTFYVVNWDLGIVEPGSSGSGLLSFDPNTALFYLRGTLTAGSGDTCNTISSARNVYARFDNLYPYIQTTLTGAPQPPPGVNYEGLWWASPAGSESGWGINLAHQGDVIFATWFTYDANGKAWWLSMTANKTTEGAYSGTLYRTNGAPFSAFVPPATATAVGSGTLTFSSSTAATFSYQVNDGGNVATQNKAIELQSFGLVPTCAWGVQPDLTKATSYQDLWWAAPAASESGWGVNVTQQGATIFATWFTYDANHNPLWLSVTAMQTGLNTYSGTLYLTNGPAFTSVHFDPAKVGRTAVGTATFTFSDGNNGTFAYNVDLGDGVNKATQAKAITRQVFRAPGTVCQ